MCHTFFLGSIKPYCCLILMQFSIALQSPFIAIRVGLYAYIEFGPSMSLIPIWSSYFTILTINYVS